MGQTLFPPRRRAEGPKALRWWAYRTGLGTIADRAEPSDFERHPLGGEGAALLVHVHPLEHVRTHRLELGV